MIQIVTGKLGAGKTLLVVMLIFEDLLKGLTVATNIALNWDAICQLARRKYRVILDPKQFHRIDPNEDKNWQKAIPFGTVKGPVKVYLDEIHLFFNARDWAKTAELNRGLVSFLSQSRKARVDITFIVQDETTLDKQFRVQAEWLLFVVNSNHLPLGPLGTLPIKFFITVQKDSQNGNVLKRTIRSYDRNYFRLYDSFSFLDTEMTELAADTPRIDPLKLSKVPLFRWILEPLTNLFPRKKCDSLLPSESLSDSCSTPSTH